MHLARILIKLAASQTDDAAVTKILTEAIKAADESKIGKFALESDQKMMFNSPSRTFNCTSILQLWLSFTLSWRDSASS